MTTISTSSTTTGSGKAGSSSSANIDMSTKVGGRIFYPALPVVDGSDPTEIELKFNTTLQDYCSTNIPLESPNGIQTRERVLDRMGTICRQWVQSVAITKGMPNDVIENATGQLYTSGSYRLGVHEPGADIDTILVAPNYCSRQDFFGTTGNSSTVTDPNNPTATTDIRRDPNSLAERIKAHPDVTNFVPVEGAAVPLLTFDWEGVNIDLLFARVNQSTVNSSDFDIDNDAVLDGTDSATEKSLNGPRVTNLIAAIVSGTPQRYQTFLTVVRCIRKWAKTRGLYSNKMGYWGGVNINIGVALAIQLYPNACPATLLRKFFLIFKTWRWPQPLMLTKPHDAGYGLPVWNIQQAQISKTNVAPMITPAYPAMNSTMSISRQTLQILQEEFNRAHDIVDTIWKDYIKLSNKGGMASDFSSVWKKLFEPSDFFISYPKYLSLCIVGPSQADVQTWAGFVESRLRKLVSDLLSRSLPLKKIQLWPKKFDVCIADKTALLTQAQRQNCITYFIGFTIDQQRMRGDQLNVEIPLQNFREWDLIRFQPLKVGMDILVKAFNCTTLPKICFDGIYEGGKIAAMKKRRAIRDADPIRQEKKRIKKLEELKLKMAEIQRKKLEQIQQKQEAEEQQQKLLEEEIDADRKRKREDVDNEDGNAILKREDDDVEQPESKILKTDLDETAVLKAEDDGTSSTKIETTTMSADGGPIIESEETELLESALDTFQEDTTGIEKTREEAEQDRQKLLSGEGLVPTNETNDEFLTTAAYESDDEEQNAIGYTGGGSARQVYYKKVTPSIDPITGALIDGSEHNIVKDEKYDDQQQEVQHKQDRRSLPISKEVAEMLRQYNYYFVDDDEMKVIGANMIPPWRAVSADEQTRTKIPKYCSINFLYTKFDVVELDAHGRVIDRGDDDFLPSRSYVGSKPGFEFKMGLRGLGYYRTGKQVIIPSNLGF